MDCQELFNAGAASLTSVTDASLLDQGILLVEDQRLVREVAGEILRSAGYRVWKAANAAEASRLFTQHHAGISLLITDLVLPDGHGPQLAGKLQAAGAHLRTILISGYPERMIREDWRCESPFFYLAKPFSAETLIRTVSHVLRPEKGPRKILNRDKAASPVAERRRGMTPTQR